MTRPPNPNLPIIAMFDRILQKLVEWKARRRAAQIIVYDGAAEIEKTRSFARGSVAGIVGTLAVVLLTAPTSLSPALLEQVEQRERLLQEAQGRLAQSVAISATCLNTAEAMGETLKTYHEVAEGYQRLLVRR